LLRLRTGSLALVCAASLVACSKSQPTASSTRRVSNDAAIEVATFTGTYDPATKKLTFETAPSTDPNALSVFNPWSDGAAGSNPDNTFEMVTLDSGTDPSGCGGSVRSFYGTVRIQSFFRNQQLQNVWVEVTSADPADFFGCTNVGSPPAGLSNANGLWSYGTLGAKGSTSPSDHADVRWDFHYSTDTAFTFHGRVMASLSAPAALAGGPAFDWTPTALVNPPRSFQRVGTTVSHIVWNGSSFSDGVAGLTFSRATATGGSVSTMIGDSVQSYATFSDGAYWVEDPVGVVTSALNLNRGFTVCAKFKPGVVPNLGIKTFFAKGNPILMSGATNPLGFALMEMNNEYCFHYRSIDDHFLAEERMSYLTGGTNPNSYTYDYICGGRADPLSPTDGYLWVGVHGAAENAVVHDETNFYDGSLLPISIGATYDVQHSHPEMSAQDNGVYEVIIDSRGATPDVMKDIVARAEGRMLPNSDGLSQIYIPANSAASTFVGGDGSTYTLPPYATVPVSSDGSGLLDSGKVVNYSHPLSVNTQSTGFCLGAVVVADGAWTAVSGTAVSFYDKKLAMVFGIDVSPARYWIRWNGDTGFDAWSDLPASDPQSAHTFTFCGTSPTDGTAPNRMYKYIDGTQVSNVATNAPPALPNLSASAQLGIGGTVQDMAASPLTGARVRRVFICPDPNPANCK
jgi:hypothetical protein